MRKFLLFFSALVTLTTRIANAETPLFNVCNDSKASICEIKEVRVNPCKEAGTRNPCKLKRSTNATIEFDFIPHFDSDQLLGEAYWANLVGDLGLPGMDKDACKATSCPVVKGQLATYKNSLFMSPIFPAFSYTVKWKIWNPLDNEKECCFTFKIKVVA